MRILVCCNLGVKDCKLFYLIPSELMSVYKMFGHSAYLMSPLFFYYVRKALSLEGRETLDNLHNCIIYTLFYIRNTEGISTIYLRQLVRRSRDKDYEMSKWFFLDS